MSIDRRSFLKISGTGAAAIMAGAGISRSAFAAVSAEKRKSHVSFAGSSQNGDHKELILNVLEPWRETIKEGIKGKKIFIKPNLVSGGKALIGTPVEAVRALLEFLRSMTSDPIIIGESAAGPGLERSYSQFGYNNLVNEFNDVILIDLDDSDIPKVDRTIWKPDFTSTRTIQIFSPFVDPQYYVISVTRPKTHNCQVITGVCKNILMGAPTGTKSYFGGTSNKQLMHGENGWFLGTNEGENKCLAYNLFQLGNTIFLSGSPSFCVLDAWEGMEGEGPGNGTSVMQYCAVAGTDPLAVDRLCAKLMGLSDTPTDHFDTANPSYTDARALYWLSNAGVGNYDLEMIKFIQGSLQELEGYVKKYQMANSYFGNQTNWTGEAPSQVFDLPEVSTRDSRFLDPKPFLFPQVRNIAGQKVRIDFSLPVAFPIKLEIYNLNGVQIRMLANEFLPRGRYSVVWDCRDKRGARVAKGKYIIRLQFDRNRVISDHITLY